MYIKKPLKTESKQKIATVATSRCGLGQSPKKDFFLFFFPKQMSSNVEVDKK